MVVKWCKFIVKTASARNAFSIGRQRCQYKGADRIRSGY